MQKNITLKLDARLLNRARHMAVDQEASLSSWLKDLIESAVEEKDDYAAARKKALAHISHGFALGDRPLSREEAHER